MTDDEIFDYLNRNNFRLHGSDLVQLFNSCDSIINDEYDAESHTCSFETISGSHYSLEIITNLRKEIGKN